MHICTAKYSSILYISTVHHNNYLVYQKLIINPSIKKSEDKINLLKGEWNIMLFPLVKDSFHKKYLCVDFMDTTAVRHMINETYEKYYERFGQYFDKLSTSSGRKNLELHKGRQAPKELK